MFVLWTGQSFQRRCLQWNSAEMLCAESTSLHKNSRQCPAKCLQSFFPPQFECLFYRAAVEQTNRRQDNAFQAIYPVTAAHFISLFPWALFFFKFYFILFTAVESFTPSLMFLGIWGIIDCTSSQRKLAKFMSFLPQEGSGAHSYPYCESAHFLCLEINHIILLRDKAALKSCGENIDIKIHSLFLERWKWWVWFHL